MSRIEVGSKGTARAITMTTMRSRRGFLAAAAACAAARGAGAGTADLIEPRMRLKARALSGASVALTLDACPGGFDTRIAEALVQMAIPASVFVTGAWIRRHPGDAVFLRAHPDVFGIENHGDRHVPPVLGARRVFGIQSAGDLATIKREVLSGAEDVEALTGAPPRWYRGATGFYSPPALEAIEGWGFNIAGYSLNADVGASLPAGRVASRIAWLPLTGM